MFTFTHRRIAIIGPSGAGKSTLIKIILFFFGELFKLRLSISCTTRPLDETEVDGIHYHSKTPEQFKAHHLNGDFAETNVFATDGKFDPLSQYGTLKSECDITHHTVLFDVDVNGAKALKQQYPDLVTIFVCPPSDECLKARLDARKRDTPEKIQKRLRQWQKDKTFTEYDYKIVNDNLIIAFAEMMSIIFTAIGGVIIAIDGTSGCGKGSVAKQLAPHYDAFCLDSGIIYRRLAYYCQMVLGRHGDEYELPMLLGLTLVNQDFWNVPESTLRTPDTDAIVAEGRDMTTVVFKHAPHKFFMDADIITRATRRAAQNKLSLEANIAALEERDRKDRTRSISPLVYNPESDVALILNEGALEVTLATIQQCIIAV